MAKTKNYYQKGVVSLFAVILSALLLTILTVGFTALMVQGQRQAMNNDLSQSAHDSALAGVEDAKRVIRACQTGNATACSALYDQPNDCRIVARTGIAGSATDKETIIRSSTGADDGSQFQQAYTCVNIHMDTPDFLVSLQEGVSDMVPLRASDDIDQIEIEWFSSDDLPAPTLASPPSGVGLPPVSGWGAAAPPLLRVQLISPGETFHVDDTLNSSAASRTVFLRPTSPLGTGPAPVILLEGYARATDGTSHSNAPYAVTCSVLPIGGGGYACKAVLDLANIEISREASKNAFLRLQTFYSTGETSTRVTLKRDGNPVIFKGGQPSVDATGRANDLFRRVEARLETGSTFIYPNYAADIENNICKDFSITEDIVTAGTCNP